MLQSIRSKVLLAILVVTIVTACSITVVFYFKSAGMIEENYSTNLYGRVKQTVTSLDDSLQEIYYINVKAASDINMVQYIKEYRSSHSGEALDGIAELLRNYRTEYKDLSSLYFIFPDERIAVTSEDYPVCKRDIPEAEIEKIRRTETEEAVPIMFGDMVHDTGKQLSCIQAVTDDDGIVLGYMLANTEERTLFYEYLEPVYDEKVSKALILDKNREIVTSKDYESVGQVYEGVDRLPSTSGIESQDAREIRIFYQGAFSKCGLYMDIQKSEVLRDLKQMQIFLVAIFLLFLMIGGILATSITRAMYKPIKNMTDTVEKVSKGDLSLRVDVTTEDEIGTLCREFNHMLDNLEDLIARVIEEERLKKDAELEALQYQITPHFMYNTLNSIKYAALIKGEKELGGLIGDFVELLQASVNKKGTFISVADELHILKNYIHLQEFRYQGSFNSGGKLKITGSGFKIDVPVRQKIEVVNEGKKLSIKVNGKQRVKTVNPVVIEGTGYYITLDGIKKMHTINPNYRGIMELKPSRTASRGIRIINEIYMEDYLKQVVPSEMPQSFGVEALKAQAIAARTYALSDYLKFRYKNDGFHVKDTTESQVYNNQVENDDAKEAIESTKGKVLMYKDTPVDAKYFSTSGGFTEAANYVW